LFGAKRLLVYGDSAEEKGLGFGVAARLPIEFGEVIESGGEVVVFGAEGLLANGEGALVERLGLGVSARDLVERC
jgi:hypothetical protein